MTARLIKGKEVMSNTSQYKKENVKENANMQKYFTVVRGEI